MFDQFIDEFSKLFEIIKSRKKYIRSSAYKDKLISFYEERWLPYSLDFKKKFGQNKFNIIEDGLYQSYKYAKSSFFEKSKVILLFKRIEKVLEGIKIDLIRKYGYVIEYNKKDDIIKDLKKFGFKGTVSYLNDAEKDYKNNKWKTACFNSRLAMEEFLREFREKITGKSVSGGTVGDHTSHLKNIKKLSNGEEKLIKNGFYGFLSNKGGHATKDIPTPEDAKLSIYLNYICYEYFLEKFGKFFI